MEPDHSETLGQRLESLHHSVIDSFISKACKMNGSAARKPGENMVVSDPVSLIGRIRDAMNQIENVGAGVMRH